MNSIKELQLEEQAAQDNKQILQMKQIILHLTQAYLQIVQQLKMQAIMESELNKHIRDMLLQERSKSLKLN